MGHSRRVSGFQKLMLPLTKQPRAGHDAPFVNNYGVWADEFQELGLDGTLDQRWPDAHCWFGEQHEVRVGRAYGRCRVRAGLGSRFLQHRLLASSTRCAWLAREQVPRADWPRVQIVASLLVWRAAPVCVGDAWAGATPIWPWLGVNALASHKAIGAHPNSPRGWEMQADTSLATEGSP